MDQDITSILLTCLSYVKEPAKAENLATVSAEQWGSVAAMARQHNVKALLYYRLKLLGIALPAGLAEELQQEYRQDAMRNTRLYQQLAKLFRLLHEKDIPVIVLKGAYLAEAVYPAIGLRSMADVDLLVKKDDLPRIEVELLALGYIAEDFNRVIAQENHDFGYHLPRNGLRLEIHWALMDSFYPFQIDMDGLWSRSKLINLSQAPAYALSPEDLLLYLCLHTAKHMGDMQIRMLCDVGEVLQRFGAELDWSRVIARTRQWGSIRSMYMILRLAQEMLRADVPSEPLVSLLPDGFDEHYFELAKEQVLTNQIAKSDLQESPDLIKLWGAIKYKETWKFIRERIFLSREIMSVYYPAPANSWRIYLYYPVRILHGLQHYGTSLWRLMRGERRTLESANIANKTLSLTDWLMSG